MENQNPGTPNPEQVNQQFNQQFTKPFGQQQLPNSTAVLVMGIISLVFSVIWCYWIGSTVAVVLGIISLVLTKGCQKLYDSRESLCNYRTYFRCICLSYFTCYRHFRCHNFFFLLSPLKNLIFSLETIIHWLETHQLNCFYKSNLGIDCPGCGIQRSFIELLNGNFTASIKMYPALLPVLFTLGLTAAHLYFKFKNGAIVIKYSFIFTISIVMVSYFIRLLT